MAGARTFQLAVEAQIGDFDDKYDPIDYSFQVPPARPGDKPDTRIITAHYPGENVMISLMALAGASASSPDKIGGIFSAFEFALADDDYSFIVRGFQRNAISAQNLADMLEDMVETWSRFPTQSPGDSPRTQARTGGRSTGRVPAEVLTRSPSHSTDSSPSSTTGPSSEL